MNERFTRAPHHSDRNAQSPNAALLIDFDNVTMGIRSNLGQELRQMLNSDIIRGQVSVQRAYADWRRYPQYVVPLSEAAVDLIYAPAYGSSKKNATDIRLAIDALELVFTRPEIGTFILLSGDSDFSSLVLKLKEYGKYVIGVGMQESSSDLLVQNCDEYYSYDSLSGLVSADEMDTDRHDPWELTEHSIKKMVERDDVMRSDRLKQVMLELDPSFDEKEIGYSKFNRFLTEASSRGILQLQKIGNGQYKVGPGSSVDVEAPSGDGGSSRGSRDGESPSPPRDLTGESGGGSDAGGGPSGGGSEEAAAASGRDEGGRGGDGSSDGGRPESGERKERREGGGSTAARERSGGERPVVETEQLREGYDLLQEVVAELSAEDGHVRDSEVKREMLNRDSTFDEGALGFSKFSRFIRQAHDEEVVDITKDSDGNYYLRPLGGTGPETPGREPSRSDESGSGDASGGGRAEPEPAPPEESQADDAARRGGGLRRRRKSGGGGKKSDSGDDSWVPGPVDAGGGSESSGTSASDPDGSGGSGPAGGDGSDGTGSGRRGLGRFRRGRKSGKGKKEGAGGDEPAPGPVSTGEASGREGDEDSSGPESSPTEESGSGAGESAAGDADPAPGSEAEEIVSHMKDHYSGVGEKTARKLVSEFGEQTLSVIDDDPRRVEELLPKHRAEAVLQARAVEREQGDRG